jgi:hypothetical protein
VRGIDPRIVDERAVGRSEILDHETAGIVAPAACMAAGDLRVVPKIAHAGLVPADREILIQRDLVTLGRALDHA